MTLDATIAPTVSTALQALRSFLLDVLPDGTEVIAGEPNRVPEPQSSNFVVMTPIRAGRLRTNVTTLADVKFTASITGTAMTVTAVETGTILDDAQVFGTGLAAGTTVVSQQSGTPGGVGVYTVTPSQTFASGTLSTGARDIEQGMEFVVQLDFHSANFSSGDAAQTVSTLFRDPYAVDFFAALELGEIVPLSADDPRQSPFSNDQQQVEYRWTLDAMLQVNQVLSVPQQFADSLTVELVDVDAEYPP